MTLDIDTSDGRDYGARGIPGAAGVESDWLAQICADKPLLLLDFDGTVCVGDGPIWAYAAAVVADLAAVPGPGTNDAATHILSGLAEFLAGSDAGVGAAAPYVDGYAAVAGLAGDYLSRDRLQAAYHASRRALATSAVAVHAPDGLADLLTQFDDRVQRVLITNAPVAGVQSTLSSIGLNGVIDHVVTDAGKPGGWSKVLPRLVASRDPATVLAVGDIWTNDLQPPHLAGCCTALIDRFRRSTAPADIVAARFEDLYDEIHSWAADPHAFAAAHGRT